MYRSTDFNYINIPVSDLSQADTYNVAFAVEVETSSGSASSDRSGLTSYVPYKCQRE